jgi:hypothetical protein
MSGVAIDWASAEVHDGKLEVGLSGELPPGWNDSFDRTVALLPGGAWGKVSIKKDRIRVHDVAEGDEDRLRHFLESVVLQANSAHQDDESEARDDPDADETKSDPRDAEMTEQFRSFAAEPDE